MWKNRRQHVERHLIISWIVALVLVGLVGCNNTSSGNNEDVCSANCQPEDSPIEYLKDVDIPPYDPTNAEHCLAVDDASFDTHIANQACIFIYVNPGTYTRKSIHADDSYTDGTMRHIVLNRNNDLHPAMLSDSEQADVPLTFNEEAANWIVDRISVLSNSDDWTTCIIVRSSSKNIVLNRLHLRDFFDGITIFGSADATNFTRDITIQNSRLDSMTDSGIDMDRVAIFIMANPWNAPYTKAANVHIVNNEIVNANDGVMPLKLEGGSNEADYEGLVIHNNHIYVDERVYTDCNGNRDPAGPCSDTEDAIDVKSGSENPLNPMIISSNRVWGFRWTDVNSGGSGSPGSGITLHLKVKNVIIKNNVIFNSYLGIFMGAAVGFPYAVESVHAHNNLIANTVRLEPGAVPEVPDSAFKATAFTETLDTTFEKNVIIGSTEITYTDQLGASGVLPGVANNASMWIYVFNSGSMTDNENLNVRDNIIISMGEAVQASPISGGGKIGSNSFFNTPVDTGSNHGTYYPNAADAHMADFTFVTDRFTNNPRTITIVGVQPTVDTPNGEGIGVGVGE